MAKRRANTPTHSVEEVLAIIAAMPDADRARVKAELHSFATVADAVDAIKTIVRSVADANPEDKSVLVGLLNKRGAFFPLRIIDPVDWRIAIGREQVLHSRRNRDTFRKISKSYEIEMAYPDLDLESVARRAKFSDRRHMKKIRRDHIKACPPPDGYKPRR